LVNKVNNGSTVQALPYLLFLSQAGFLHFELDVQLTSDDEVIVFHDEKLGRTLQGSPEQGNSFEIK
jgi:glycerophosphoryl diester phosphodiesterase